VSTDPTAAQAAQAAQVTQDSQASEVSQAAQAMGGAQDERAQAQQAQPTQPSEDELRAAYEAEMSRISSADMILQATVSLLNIGGYRLGLGPGRGSPGQEQAADEARDLEQVRDAIDGARALLPILERTQPTEMRPLRDALSQLQMAYARAAGANSAAAEQASAQAPAGATSATGAPGAAGAERDTPGQARQKPDEPGPAQSSGRLWVPGR
jgi:hypothetical protein